MKFKDLKLEFFYWRKAFGEYRAGFCYLKNKYWLAPRILQSQNILEKPLNNSDLSIHVLTCHRDLLAALWSLAGFYQVSSVIGQLYIHDDGSLTAADKILLQKFFPAAKIIAPDQGLAAVRKSSDFSPAAIAFRQTFANQPFVKKIFDSLAVSPCRYRLLFDTDVVWYKDPELIWQSLKDSAGRSWMQTGAPARCFVSFKDGGKLADSLAGFNAGIIFYDRANFSQVRFTDYLTKLNTAEERNFYFFEQAGHAYCLDNLAALPADLFALKNSLNAQTVARHYTKPRRPLFYIEGLEILKNKLL